MKYLVMECHAAYAVVLGEDGSFRKAANLHYQVGQTVTDITELQLPEVIEPPKRKRPWRSALTALAACLVLVFTALFFRMPYASVYLTINPQVRIDVNRQDMVIGVAGINPDGETLLSGYDHRHKDLETVMDELVDLAIDMGYLHEGGKITLDLDGNETWVSSHEDSLNQQLKLYLTDRITVTIDIDPPPETGSGYGESDYGDNGDSGYDDDHDDDDDDD